MSSIRKVWPLYIVWILVAGGLFFSVVFVTEDEAAGDAEATEGIITSPLSTDDQDDLDAADAETAAMREEQAKYLALFLYIILIPGPIMLGFRRWRGASGLLVCSIFTLVLLGLFMGLLSQVMPGVMSQVGIIFGENTNLLAGGVAAGLLLGVVLSIPFQSRGICQSCGKAIRLWQDTTECATHSRETENVFHLRCTVRVNDSVFTSHDKEDLQWLVLLSRGAFPRSQDFGHDRPPLCQPCFRAHCVEALHHHVQHSDFLSPMKENQKGGIRCGYCDNVAPGSSSDSTQVNYSLNLGPDVVGGDVRLQLYKLGPMIICPQCGSRFHLVCWIAQGGCKHHGEADAHGNVCAMGGRRLEGMSYAVKGWPQLCGIHASRDGWKTRGTHHRDVPVPMISSDDSEGDYG